MKKQILILSILLSGSAIAQDGIPQGSIYGGATLNFFSEKSVNEFKNGSVTVKDEPSIYRYYLIQPEITYFVANNFSLGLTIGASGSSWERTSKTTNPDVTTVRLEKSSGPVFGLIARKFWNITDNFYSFAGAGVNLEMTNGKNTVTTTEDNVSVEVKTESEMREYNLILSAGLAYHITNRVMLMGSVATLRFFSNVNKNNITPDSYDQTKRSGIDLFASTSNNPFNLGLIFLLNPK